MQKSDIRARIRAQKSLLTAAEALRASQSVFAMLQRTAAFMLADKILMYHSLADELSTREFLNAWSARKQFFLPRVNGVNLDILPFDRSRLHLGAFQIEEPDGDEGLTPVDEIEMVVVPAVAYDKRGNRVGRGKGFYDRLLKDVKAVKVGIGYDFQLIDDEIETDPHDVPVDIVITPTRIIYTRRQR